MLRNILHSFCSETCVCFQFRINPSSPSLISLHYVYLHPTILRSKFYRASTNIEKIFLVKNSSYFMDFLISIDIAWQMKNFLTQGKSFSASECFPLKSHFWCLTSCKENSFRLNLRSELSENLINNFRKEFFALDAFEQQRAIFVFHEGIFILWIHQVLFGIQCAHHAHTTSYSNSSRMMQDG
jgi:hypothetical protein